MSWPKIRDKIQYTATVMSPFVMSWVAWMTSRP